MAKKKKQEAAPVPPTLPFAVIDIGTTSVRMIIAQADMAGGIRTLEFLHQAVSLGKDTFTKGNIARVSIENCVGALKSFRKLLEEYQIMDDDRIRAVATTAVREAANVDAFIDRISIGTGINVEPIDEVDVARLTYLSFRAYLQQRPSLAGAEFLVAEVGGGSTELLFFQDGGVAFSQTYRLGTMRMHEMLEEFSTTTGKQQQLIESQIQRTISAIQQSVTPKGTPRLIALGSDVRFAASQILRNWDPDTPTKLPVKELARFTDDVLKRSPNELVREYRLSYPDAETVGQALQFYVDLARAYGLRHIILTDISMRHGLLLEAMGQSGWSDDFRSQIIHSALEIARKYNGDLKHGEQVAFLAETLFDFMQDEHRLSPRCRLILTVASLLHDIGGFISTRSHHKHSMYLIENCEIFGLGRKDQLLVALTARYHRRASPKPTHLGYNSLQRQDRLAVAKMSAILRVADALDRSNSQRVRKIACFREDGRMVIAVPSLTDLSLEQLALKNKGSMFEDVYGMRVMLRTKKTAAN